MKCAFCDNEKTQVAYEHYVCNDPKCVERAIAGRVSINLALTKFGRDA